MKKALIAASAILFTIAYIGIGVHPEKISKARIVTVQRDNVYRTMKLSGTLKYSEESIVLAKSGGMISHVARTKGERVAKDDLIARINSDLQDAIHENGMTILNENLSGLDSIPGFIGTIRAPSNCTIRDIYVKEGELVTRGVPIARVSSNQQEVVCMVHPADAEQLSPGMWGWMKMADGSTISGWIDDISDVIKDSETGMSVQVVTFKPERYVVHDEGYEIDVEIYLDGSNNVLSLPVEAVTDRETVWWVNNGRCTEIPAEIVMFDENLVWVGLPEGMKVAVGEFDEGQLVQEAEQ